MRRKWMGLLLTAVMSFLLMACGNSASQTADIEAELADAFSAFTSSADSTGTESTTEGAEEDTENQEAEQISEAEAEEDEQTVYVSNVVMSDDLFDYTVKIDGTVYQFPCAYTDFTDSGWVLNSSYDSEDDIVDGESNTRVSLKRNDCKITVYINNTSGNSRAVKDCEIVGISTNGYDCPELEFTNGITINSTVDEILEAYGTPDEQRYSEDYHFTTIRYTENNKTYTGYKFVIMDSGIDSPNQVDVENFAAEDSKITQAETIEERPDYLDEYIAPQELGSDILSGNIEIDGNIYKMPCPLTEFINNGWEIKKMPDYVPAGGYEDITLIKNGHSIMAYIQNFTDYQTTAINCAVYEVIVYEEQEVSCTLPGGILLGSSKSEVETAVTDEFEYSENSPYYYRYTYKQDNLFLLCINVDMGTEKVSYIELRCRIWDY